VEVERTSSIAGAPARKVLPLILRPCQDLPNFPRFLRQIQTVDVSTVDKFEANYPRICRKLGGEPRDDAIPIDRTKLPPVRPLSQRHRMPYRSLGDKFVGRIDSIWNLHDSLFRDGTTILSGEVVIAGTGGLGKTQLAIEYAHRLGASYSGVYWIDADQGLSTLIAQVCDAAGIEVDPKADQANQLEQVWRGLNRLPGASLLILDNFPENEPLQPYLPVSDRIHTLITTRRQDLNYRSVRLKTLTTEEGVRLLNSGEKNFGSDAAALVDRLGGLPLALELARGYLNYRKTLTIADLQQEMDDACEIGLLAEFTSEYRDHLPSRHETDVVRTFQLSWDATPEFARKVLRVMGELAPATVPRFLLRLILDLPTASGIRDPLAKALDELSRLSLVDLDTDGNPISHRLVLAFARYRNEADNESPFNQCAAAIQQQMNRASLLPNADTIRELKPLVAHGEFLLASDLIPYALFSQLADGLGTHYLAIGRYADAKRLQRAALASDEKTFEPEHPSIATRQSKLALALEGLGQLEEARDCCARPSPLMRKRSSSVTLPSPSVNRIWPWCYRNWGSSKKRGTCYARPSPPMRRPSSPVTPPSPAVNRIWPWC
jgi:hypothetical protein